MADEPTSPEQQLAWEADHRRRGVGAAAGAAVLLVVGGLISTISISRGFPSVGVVQAIGPALEGRAPTVNPHIAAAKLVSDRSAGLLASVVLLAIGTLLMAYALHFLYVATKARRPETPPTARALLLTAPVALAVLSIVRQFVVESNAKDFVRHASPTEDYQHGVYAAGANSIVDPLSVAAQLALAAAIVLISLNAMRAGLLSRFMGVLGMIVAFLFVIPLFAGGLPVVQIVWLGLLATLFALRWPGGQPPAWTSGKAEPWPTGAEVRAQREAATAHREAQAIKAAPGASEAAEPIKPQHPSSKKRRKKRR